MSNIDSIKEIINGFAAHLSHEEALNLALQSVAEVYNCNSCAIITINENACQTIKAAKGLSNDYIKSFYSGGGNEIIECVMKNKKAVLITKGHPYFNQQGFKFEHGYQSLFIVPLSMHDMALGVMYMDFTDDKALSPSPSKDEQKAFLDTANMCSIIIDHEIKTSEYIKTLNIDGLTGLYTCKYFNEELHKEIRRALKFKHPISIMIASIGHMSEYNATYGYTAGNEAIRAIASAIKSNLHDIDVISRFAARFAMIFPEIDSSEVKKTAEKIISDLLSSDLFKDKMPELALRVGIASFPKDAEDEASLLNIAEKNLYESVRKGGNSITVS